MLHGDFLNEGSHDEAMEFGPKANMPMLKLVKILMFDMEEQHCEQWESRLIQYIPTYREEVPSLRKMRVSPTIPGSTARGANKGGLIMEDAGFDDSTMEKGAMEPVGIVSTDLPCWKRWRISQSSTEKRWRVETEVPGIARGTGGS